MPVSRGVASLRAARLGEVACLGSLRGLPFPIARPPRREIRTVVRVARNLLLLAVVGLLALPAASHATPVSDCAADGDLDKSYSDAELQKALDNIPGDLDEYSNCRQVIRGALSSGSDKGENRPASGSPGGGGGGSISAEEEAARAADGAELQALTGGGDGSSPSVNVGGEKVEPGTNGLFDLASASNDLPVPLLVALVAIGLLAIVGGLVALRERVPALARIPLLSKIPRVPLPRFRR
jgi:hypothetical protein